MKSKKKIEWLQVEALLIKDNSNNQMKINNICNYFRKVNLEEEYNHNYCQIQEKI